MNQSQKKDTQNLKAGVSRRHVAPAAYRPQPVPKVLQRKTAPSQTGPNANRQTPPTPKAPPVYRPQSPPKVLQRKAAVGPTAPPASRPLPVAPPRYRPDSSPKVLQRQVVAPPLTQKPAAVVVQRMCAPLPGLIQPGTAIQLARKDGKGKQSKTPKTTKSGKLTKREAQKQEERQQRQAEKAAKEKEIADKREWQEKARLGIKKEMAKTWEENKEIFDQWAHGTSATPPNATAPRYPIPIVDLRDIRQDNPHLARLIDDSLLKIEIRPNTPEHGNIEGRFPIYDRDVTPLAYFEFSFLGGGGRMVVDTIAGIVYISMHYKYNYQLLDSGRPPAHAVQLARQQRANTMHFLAMQHEEAEAEALVMHVNRESPRVERRSPRMVPLPMDHSEELAESVVAHVLDDDDEIAHTPTPPSPPIRSPLRPIASYELWSLYGSGAAIWGHDIPARRWRWRG